MADQQTPDTAAGVDKPYEIVGAPVHSTRFDDTTQRVQSGWTVQARWLANGSVIEVFVPDDADLPATADAQIRYQGDQLDQLHALSA